MPWTEWYNSLAKPNWTPAPSTIGMIWQILYPVNLISFGFVFIQAFRGKISWIIALPFAINLLANLIFTPIQFGLRNLPLAALDILIIWATILWCMVDQVRAESGVEMTPLLLPYIFNIIVLIPIGLMTLLGGEKGYFTRSLPSTSPLRQKTQSQKSAANGLRSLTSCD